MRKEDEPHDNRGHLERLSLHRLGVFAMEEKLIEGLEIYEDHVTIIQDENRFLLPSNQASTFLIGMLRGRSWFIEDDEPFETRPASTEGSMDVPDERIDPLLQSTLNSLLELTKKVGILQGYEKDEQTHTVRIDIPACSTILPYGDALGYLIDCIQHELRTSRGER